MKQDQNREWIFACRPFLWTLPDCGPKKRETEGYDYQFDTLTNRPSPPSRLPEGDLKFTGKECTKEV
ncbi:hypothetical protein ACRASS_01335 [Bacteroides hominis]|uniref:hypothetical protein n=1 Tax=Bacteroides hominis TaxID=2763023 RepID=UPI003D6A34D5